MLRWCCFARYAERASRRVDHHLAAVHIWICEFCSSLSIYFINSGHIKCLGRAGNLRWHVAVAGYYPKNENNPNIYHPTHSRQGQKVQHGPTHHISQSRNTHTNRGHITHQSNAPSPSRPLQSPTHPSSPSLLSPKSRRHCQYRSTLQDRLHGGVPASSGTLYCLRYRAMIRYCRMWLKQGRGNMVAMPSINGRRPGCGLCSHHVSCSGQVW